MNLSAIRDRARALSGIRLQTLRSDEQIDAVINEAYFEVISLAQWPFLRASSQVTVTAGTDSFTTPSAFSEVISATYSDQIGNTVRLVPTTVDEIDRLDAEDSDPVYYARVDDSEFLIWPTPTTSLTISLRGKQKVNELSADSDSPVFDEQFHPILAYRAASRLLAEESDESGRAELYQAEANSFFLRMQQFYMRTSDVGMFVMGGRRRKTIDGR